MLYRHLCRYNVTTCYAPTHNEQKFSTALFGQLPIRVLCWRCVVTHYNHHKAKFNPGRRLESTLDHASKTCLFFIFSQKPNQVKRWQEKQNKKSVKRLKKIKALEMGGGKGGAFWGGCSWWKASRESTVKNATNNWLRFIVEAGTTKNYFSFVYQFWRNLFVGVKFSNLSVNIVFR